ncbi:TonB-dependent receptor [Sphingomonas metalli]|uniref:TonB-dependent receptor n=1 Tax=Sphingomonas metalli TaxID=1779358 RepID=A0A916TBH5_9SPHN|nr:TonB-dependent receptor [Sphingomonas metalli]GGB36239.1 TonB-dependent receptor [Sphingomonas metalli]
MTSRITLLASTALFGLAAPAAAQTDPAGPAAQPVTTVPPTTDAADQSADIVVTAQKSSETLSRAPIAVSVVSQALLDRQGLTTGEQLATTVPTLKLSQNGFAIRGIGSNNGFSGYSTVATQFDGIYNPSSAALTLGLFDLGSIEVLRGPQGTVYGRNATAGVVNVNTADPGRTYGGSASVQYGRFDDVRLQAAVDLPVSDTLAVRVAGFRQVNDGYGPRYRTRRFDQADLLGARVTALWRIAPSLTWRLSGSYGENRGTAAGVFLRNYNYYPQANLVAGTFGPVTIIPSDAINPGLDTVTENRQNLRSYDVRSRLTWDAAAGLSFTYLAGYLKLKNDGVTAASGVFSQEYIGQATESWSHELDVNYQTGPLKLVAGAYLYKDSQNDGQRLLHAGNTAPAPFNTVYNLFGAKVAGTGNQISTIDAVDVVNTYSDVGSRSRAVFGQATLSPIEGIRLIGGVRATWDRAIDREQQLVCPGNSFTRRTVSAATCPTFTIAYTDDRTRPEAKFSKVNWRLGIDADVTRNVLAYATVSTGYRAGGLQPSSNPAGYRQYAPENVTNYEAGLRANLLDRRLFIGLTAYQMDYDGLQVSTIIVDPVQGPIPVTTNAAKARIRGIELETTLRPTPADRLSGYLSVLDTRFQDFRNAPDNLRSADTVYNIFAPILGFAAIPSAIGDFSGNRLPNAPKLSGRISYGHDFATASGWKITPTIDFYAQTRTFATADNVAQGRLPGYTKTDLNLQLAAPGDAVYLNVFVYNVEDRRIPVNVVPVWSSTTASYAPPRTYGVRFGFRY